MSEIRHIVFDIGKVLVHYDPELAYLDLIPDASERRRFLDTVCTSAWNLEQDRGRSWREAEALLIGRHPDRRDHIEAFRRNWRRMVPYAYEDSVAIFRGLIAAGHDVTMLTNFAPDTFREAQSAYPFLTESRGVTVSGEVKMLKPDREIYEHHAASFGLDPAATLFIDDMATNAEGVKTAGWQAVHFTGAPALAHALRERGLAF